MKTYDKIGIQIPEVYLPDEEIDPQKWAVVACDQYTSEPEYWDQVNQIVGDSPSALHLILPEIYLGTPEAETRTEHINLIMEEYLCNGVLQPFDGMLYIERKIDGKTRKGLILCLDLERYDFNKGTQSLIRPTEGTIVERIWPRVRIREQAALELSHIMVLIDDPQRTVIEPLQKLAGQAGDKLVKRYDFDLMMDSGHLTGYQVVDPQVEGNVVKALEALAEPEAFHRKYGVGQEQQVLLFAMGDGNHSLATAKAIWEKVKPQVGMDHPARYALVELENVHDQALEFEPIHRVLFNLKEGVLEAMQRYYGPDFTFITSKDFAEMVAAVEAGSREGQVFGLIAGDLCGVGLHKAPHSNLAVGTLQAFLDTFLKDGGAEKIDYVHGAEVVNRFGRQAGNAGFYLPGMDKNDLFKTVILDGALPRKTFSMGEAKEKRFYMESRRIK